MKGRQRFVCIKCGVLISGRMNEANGRIFACDRAPDSDAPPEPCICSACAERELGEVQR